MKKYLFYSIAITYLFLVVVGLFFPEDILDRSLFFSELVEFWRTHGYSLDAWVNKSHFPQVTAVFFAVAWSLFPLQCLLCLVCSLDGGMERLRAIAEEKGKNFYVFLMKIVAISIFLVGICSLSFFFFEADIRWYGMSNMSSSRATLTCLMTVLSAVLALFGSFLLYLPLYGVVWGINKLFHLKKGGFYVKNVLRSSIEPLT